MAKIIRRIWTSQGPTGRKVKHVAWGYTLQVNGTREKRFSSEWGSESDALAALAERHWGELRSKVKEAWLYEPAWAIYFDDAGVVAMVHRVSSIAPRD